MAPIGNINKLQRGLIEEIRQEGNEDQLKALNEIFYGNMNVFITGKAGTGKTYFMRRLIKALKNCIVVAPTGIAAKNCGGSTLHSRFRLPIEPFIPQIDAPYEFLDPEYDKFGKKDYIRFTKYLIIDEISMVRSDILDRVSDVLRRVRRNDKPFGGLRLIMFGDLSQLPPVSRDNDILLKYYKSNFFFSSYWLMISGYKIIEFKKLYRQTEAEFINILNELRENMLSKKSIDLLNKRVVERTDMPNTICLTSKNQEALDINEWKLRSIESDQYTIESNKFRIPPEYAQCEDLLKIKVGAQVLITRNLNDIGVVNGDIATISKINISEEAYINENNYYNVDDIESISVVKEDESEVDIYPVKFENIKYNETEKGIEKELLGYTKQFPIKIGYAITIHKSQGMTMSRVAIKASSIFEHGQLYTALSRCRSLYTLYLENPVNEKMLIYNEFVDKFYTIAKRNNYVMRPLNKEEYNILKLRIKKNKKKNDRIIWY